MKKKKNKAAVLLGKLGGKAISKRGKTYMSELGKLGAKARWKNKVEKTKKST